MIKWKNKNFRELGIIVENTPKISKPKKRINTFDVPFRNGFVSIDEGTYEPFTLSIECHARENINFDEICEFLDGYGTLSLDGKKEYTAIINNSIPFEKVLMFKKFIIQFLVNPICKDITPIIYNVSSNNDILTIDDTYYEIEPSIILKCSGDISITINNETFHLTGTDGNYKLDSENKIITKDSLNMSSIMSGDFPKLKKGQNEISYIGTITDFEIEYKRTYLWGG